METMGNLFCHISGGQPIVEKTGEILIADQRRAFAGFETKLGARPGWIEIECGAAKECLAHQYPVDEAVAGRCSIKALLKRSEERRGGKECVSKLRYRWCADY